MTLHRGAFTDVIDQRGGVGELTVRRAANYPGLAPVTFSTRLVGDGGGFEGWLCVFNVRDAYGTEFAPGAFAAGGLDELPYAYLWMHDPWVPTATFVAEERQTDDMHGLWISGEYDTTSDGQDARTRALSGSAPEMSVGFVWLDSDEDDEDLITKARLVEGSQITRRFAAVPGAAVTAVKSTADVDGDRLRALACARLDLALVGE